jgi:hypothetical protein
MMLSASFVALVLALPALGDLVTGIPDPAPAGYEQWISPIVVPAKNITGDGGWADALAKARKLVAGLTLEEKINVTTGVDVYNRCVGNTGVCMRSLCACSGRLYVVCRPFLALAGRASALRTPLLASVSQTTPLLCAFFRPDALCLI